MRWSYLKWLRFYQQFKSSIKIHPQSKAWNGISEQHIFAFDYLRSYNTIEIGKNNRDPIKMVKNRKKAGNSEHSKWKCENRLR